MFQNTDFTDCKYPPGTRVCAACAPTYGSPSGNSWKCKEPTHTVFAITDVSKNHGGPGVHYYHCEAMEGPAKGACVHIYESKIVLVDKPSDSPKLNPITPEPIVLPIPMVLHCPRCSGQHIDKEETEEEFQARHSLHSKELKTGARVVFLTRWKNPPHKSHLCAGCGCIWRPADVPTTGVKSVKQGEHDTWSPYMMENK